MDRASRLPFAWPAFTSERSSRAQAGRSAGPAADHLRAGRQPKDREGARPDRAALAAGDGRRGHRVKRRMFLAAIGGGALAGPIVAVAQQPAGIPRIGLLMGANPTDEAAK